MESGESTIFSYKLEDKVIFDGKELSVKISDRQMLLIGDNFLAAAMSIAERQDSLTVLGADAATSDE